MSFEPLPSSTICRTTSWTGFWSTPAKRASRPERSTFTPAIRPTRWWWCWKASCRRASTGPTKPFYDSRRQRCRAVLPYSRMKVFPATGRAVQPSRMLIFPTALFDDLLSHMPELGQRLVATMVDRTREVTRMEQQRDRLAALGKLSAGLAHELEQSRRRGAAHCRTPAQRGGRFSRLRQQPGRNPTHGRRTARHRDL